LQKAKVKLYRACDFLHCVDRLVNTLLRSTANVDSCVAESQLQGCLVPDTAVAFEERVS
jgi:hypothetical protein